MFPNMEYIKTLVNGLKTAANSRFLNLEKWVAGLYAKLQAEISETKTAIAEYNADWNTAEGETGHVLNRTHYTRVDVLGSVEVTEAASNTVAGVKLYDGVKLALSKEIDFTKGPPLSVIFDGVRYDFAAPTRHNQGTQAWYWYYGNPYQDRTGSQYPFCLYHHVNPTKTDVASVLSVRTWKTGELKAVEEVVVPIERKYLSNTIPIIRTEGTGAAYTANCDAFGKLELGALIVMIPHTDSTSQTPTLNINGTGAVNINAQRASNTAYSYQLGTTTAIKAGSPVLMMYSGYWRVMNLTAVDDDCFHSAVKVKNGGTGRSTLASGSYLVGNGTSNVNLKTPAQVLEDIGAIPKPATAEVGQLLAVKAVDDAGVPTEWEVVDIPDQTILTSPSGTKYRITVGDDGTLTTTEVTA